MLQANTSAAASFHCHTCAAIMVNASTAANCSSSRMRVMRAIMTGAASAQASDLPPSRSARPLARRAVMP